MQQLLYHEPQVAALCGVHCLNTLLQGPIFSEVDLAQIAQELDALEAALLGGSQVAGEAGNVDASGMFSIQVLSKALEVWGLTATPLNSPEMAGVAHEPQKENAFLCNLQEHWFTIRRVAGDQWFNFNSIFPAPEALSQFYLAAFLASLQDQGYTIFVVRGQLPRPQAPAQPGPAGPGRWFSVDEAKRVMEEAAATRQRGKVANALETALARAAAGGGALTLRSRKRPVGGEGGPGDDLHADEEADLAAAIAASLGEGGVPPEAQQLQGLGGAGPSGASGLGSFGGPGLAGPGGFGVAQGPAGGLGLSASTGAGAGAGIAAGTGSAGARGASPGDGDDWELVGGMEEDEDPELAAAIAASLEEAAAAGGPAAGAGAGMTQAAAAPAPELPQEPLEAEPDAGAEGVVELAFRLPGGARASRRFHKAQPTSQLYRYLEVEHGLGRQKHVLATAFPRAEVPVDTASLEAAGLSGGRMMLNVEVKR